jgi:hypothetical protein
MKDADWTKWSAIAEILSAVAIVITLLYLALQTSQNSQAIRAAAIQDLAAQDLSMSNLVVVYPEIMEFLVGSRELEAHEAQRLYGWLIGLLRTRESYYRQYILGVIDEDEYLRMEEPLLAVLTVQRINNLWQSQKAAFYGAFVDRIDNQLEGRETGPGIGRDAWLESVFGSPD